MSVDSEIRSDERDATSREKQRPLQWGRIAQAGSGEEGTMANGATSSQHEAHWEKTKTLTIITMVIWAFFSFGIHWFATALNSFTFFGWPVGFYMAAQGSLIVFVVLIWWSANRQEKIDEEFGFAEDEQ
jgi:putative solute:sodium symporter small subunit